MKRKKITPTISGDREKELIRRSRDFKEGTVKTYTWEETKLAAIEKVKAQRMQR